MNRKSVRVQVMNTQRATLESAFVQDFIDGLPRPIGASQLAGILRVSRHDVYMGLRRGSLVATKLDDIWLIDPQRSRTWIEKRYRRLVKNIRADRATRMGELSPQDVLPPSKRRPVV